MEIMNEKENSNTSSEPYGLFSCAKCKYNTKQEKSYEKHLLTAKHKKNCYQEVEGSKKNYKELFDKECKRVQELQKELDELKSNNSMLITKLLELTEKHYNLQNEKSKVVNNVTNNTFNNNQTYNINIYLNQGLMEIQGSVTNPDTNTLMEFTRTLPLDDERLAKMALCDSMDLFQGNL
jgi:hypothetical protein